MPLQTQSAYSANEGLKRFSTHATRNVRLQAKAQAASAEMTPSAVPELSDEARQSYDRLAKEMFAIFRAGGQLESAAKVNVLMAAKDGTNLVA